MSKHALDLLSPSPSPSKRTRFEPGTSSPPHRYTTAATSDSSPFTRYSFPSSGTGPSTPYSIPSDSPSNPFGLQRALVALKLPQPTGFRRHVPLRFQLVYDPPRRDAKGKGKAQADGGEDADASRALARELENVYRVVQVPANYTFRHLHKLILWLFAADAHWAPPPGAKLPTRHRRSTRLKELRTPLSGRRAASLGSVSVGKRHAEEGEKALRPAMGAEVPSGWAGHVFEVRDGVQMYNPKYRPGAIKRDAGRVRVRLSSERDRRLFPDLYGDDPFVDQCAYAAGEGEGADAVSAPETGFEGDVDDESADDADSGEEEEEKEWVWEAEDDYTVGHVWETGTEEDKGVIYHHLPGVSVHITTSSSALPPRRGISNQPHVFRWRGSARGALRIAHLAPSPTASTPLAAPRVRLSDETFEDETDTDERRLRRWNALDAFARFLAQEEERERALRRPRDSHRAWISPRASPAHSAPRAPSSSPSSTRSPLPPSSPPRYSASPTRAGGVAFPLLASPQTSPRRARTLSYPLLSSPPGASLGPFPLTTPFPAHPLLARRVRRASRRFERITRSGLREMESEEEGRRGRKRRRRAEEMVEVVAAGRREERDGGDGSEGTVLVPDSDGENGVQGEEFDGDALFAEGVDGDDGGAKVRGDVDGGGADSEDEAELGDGDVGDLQSDDFWRGVGGLDAGYPQWIGQGREEDWDPFADVEL